MKIKKVLVKSKGVEEFYKDVERDLKQNSLRSENSEIYIEDINALKKVLTPERLRMLKVIKHKKPNSVYSLAKLLQRDRSNVITDLNILHNAGFVEMKKDHGVRAMAKPLAKYDRIEVSIEL